MRFWTAIFTLIKDAELSLTAKQLNGTGLGAAMLTLLVLAGMALVAFLHRAL